VHGLAFGSVTAAMQGFLTGAALIVAIGAQNAFVLRQGIRREHVGVVVVLCAAADALLIAAGVAGLGPLITAHPAGITVARVGGAAFLVVVGALAARRALRPGRLEPAGASPTELAAVVVTCLGLTFLNPHVYLDTVVLLGSLAYQHPGAEWLFAAGAILASATWFTVLGFGARRLRPFFARPGSWRVLDAGIAVVMLGLAVALLL
jgi:L-lysine exporter family protein LysE/ArgO